MSNLDVNNINLSVLKSMQSNFESEKNNFSNSTYRGFTNSYINTNRDKYVLKIAKKLNEIYSEIENTYKNINKWWIAYNKDVEILEKCMNKTSTPGSFSESGLRNYAKNLVDLPEYKCPLELIYIPTTTNANVILDNGKETIKNIANGMFNVNSWNSLTSPAISGIFDFIESTEFGSGIIDGINDFFNIDIEEVTKTIVPLFCVSATALTTSGSNTEEELTFEKDPIGYMFSGQVIDDIGEGIDSTIKNVSDGFDNTMENMSKGLEMTMDFCSSAWSDICDFSQDVYEFNEEVKEKTRATVALAWTGLVEGVAWAGESLVDGLLVLGTLYNKSQANEQAFYLGTDPNQYYNDNYKGAEEWVANVVKEEHVKTAFDDFYENNEIGSYLYNNAYAPETVRAVSNGVGYFGSYTVVGIATGGTSFLGTATTAGLSFVGGTGRYTSDALNEGYDFDSASKYGIARGTWDSIEVFVGSGISKLKLFKGFSATTNQLLNTGAHVFLDGVDSATGAVVDPIFQMILGPNKDNVNQVMSYYNVTDPNSEYYGKTWNDLSFDEKYMALFEYNGGTETVLNNALFGMVLSGASEIPDIKLATKIDGIVNGISGSNGNVGKEVLDSLSSLDGNGLKELLDFSDSKGLLRDVSKNLNSKQMASVIDSLDTDKIAAMLFVNPDAAKGMIDLLDEKQLKKLYADLDGLYVFNNYKDDVVRRLGELNVKSNNVDVQTLQNQLYDKSNELQRLLEIKNSAEYAEYMDNARKGYAQRLNADYDGLESKISTLQKDIYEMENSLGISNSKSNINDVVLTDAEINEKMLEYNKLLEISKTDDYLLYMDEINKGHAISYNPEYHNLQKNMQKLEAEITSGKYGDSSVHTSNIGSQNLNLNNLNVQSDSSLEKLIDSLKVKSNATLTAINTNLEKFKNIVGSKIEDYSAKFNNLIGGPAWKKSVPGYDSMTKKQKEIINSFFRDDFVFDETIAKDLYNLIDDDYVYGIHVTPELNFADNIRTEGLLLTGSSFRNATNYNGFDSNQIFSGMDDFSRNINGRAIREGSEVFDYMQLVKQIQAASSYNGAFGKGYAMIIAIPKDKIGSNIGEIVNIGGHSGIDVLKPEYIVGQIEVQNGNILASPNTIFNSNFKNNLSNSSVDFNTIKTFVNDIPNIAEQMAVANYNANKGITAVVRVSEIDDLPENFWSYFDNPQNIIVDIDGHKFTYDECVSTSDITALINASREDIFGDTWTPEKLKNFLFNTFGGVFDNNYIQSVSDTVHIVDESEWASFLRFRGLSSGTAGFVDSNHQLYLPSNANMHTAIHESLHKFSEFNNSTFDLNGTTYKVTGIRSADNLQSSNWANELLTEYLSSKLYDGKFYASIYDSRGDFVEVWERIDDLMDHVYGKDSNVLLNCYLSNNVDFLKDFFSYSSNNKVNYNDFINALASYKKSDVDKILQAMEKKIYKNNFISDIFKKFFS